MQKKLPFPFTLLFLLSISAGGVALGGTQAASNERVLYSFGGSSDGAEPHANLIMDPSGNLYGTTDSGGTSDVGTVFKLLPDGSEIVLYSFSGGSDGAYPYAGLILDTTGNFYGTTKQGGTSDQGTVFQITPSGELTILYSFAGGDDGANPLAGLVMDEAGNLYGTTSLGGIENYGTIFKLAPDGTESVLHSFWVYTFDGRSPAASMMRDKAGNLYAQPRPAGRVVTVSFSW